MHWKWTQAAVYMRKDFGAKMSQKLVKICSKISQIWDYYNKLNI